MADKKLTDAQRQLVLVLFTKAWVEIRDDIELMHNAHEMTEVIELFSGTDTEIISRKARHRS